MQRRSVCTSPTRKVQTFAWRSFNGANCGMTFQESKLPFFLIFKKVPESLPYHRHPAGENILGPGLLYRRSSRSGVGGEAISISCDTAINFNMIWLQTKLNTAAHILTEFAPNSHQLTSQSGRTHTWHLLDHEALVRTGFNGWAMIHARARALSCSAGGVLNDFSCHMRRGSSPIWEL